MRLIDDAVRRPSLPTPDGPMWLTEGGAETTFVFHDGIELPMFASFTMLSSDHGRNALRRYYARYTELARRAGCGLIIDTQTWRASSDWGRKLGIGEAALARINRRAVAFAREIRAGFSGSGGVLISGCIGPRGDGYQPETLMTIVEAEDYHRRQIGVLADAGVDMIGAITMTHTGEAIGIARMAARAGIPSVISFTLETDGRLPSGQSLGDAIAETDFKSIKKPAYYMINCAHPDHFIDVLRTGGNWRERIGGLRANASRCSHAELDEAATLDDGDPRELGIQYRELMSLLTNLRVLGGCCGTDDRHVGEIAGQCIMRKAA